MRKSFFTVDFQNKETKTESSRPGLRSGVSVCQKGVRSTEDEHAAQRKRSSKPATQSGAGRPKGCEAPRASTPRSGSAVRSLRRKAGRAAKKGAKHRGPSTPRSGSAVRSPRRKAGRAAKKGAKHRGRARRAAAAHSEACDAKRGRPQKGCEAPRTRTALKGLPQSEARDAKRGGPPKGCEARNPQGNGLLEGFLHSLSLKNKLRIDNGTLWI